MVLKEITNSLAVFNVALFLINIIIVIIILCAFDNYWAIIFSSMWAAIGIFTFFGLSIKIGKLLDHIEGKGN